MIKIKSQYEKLHSGYWYDTYWEYLYNQEENTLILWIKNTEYQEGIKIEKNINETMLDNPLKLPYKEIIKNVNKIYYNYPIKNNQYTVLNQSGLYENLRGLTEITNQSVDGVSFIDSFCKNTKLKNIPFSDFKTIISAKNAFENTALEKVILKKHTAINLETIEEMFQKNEFLTELDLSQMKVIHLKNMNGLISHCPRLSILKLPDIKDNKYKIDMKEFRKKSHNLKKIIAPNQESLEKYKALITENEEKILTL